MHIKLNLFLIPFTYPFILQLSHYCAFNYFIEQCSYISNLRNNLNAFRLCKTILIKLIGTIDSLTPSTARKAKIVPELNII